MRKLKGEITLFYVIFVCFCKFYEKVRSCAAENNGEGAPAVSPYSMYLKSSFSGKGAPHHRSAFHFRCFHHLVRFMEVYAEVFILRFAVSAYPIAVVAAAIFQRGRVGFYSSFFEELARRGFRSVAAVGLLHAAFGQAQYFSCAGCTMRNCPLGASMQITAYDAFISMFSSPLLNCAYYIPRRRFDIRMSQGGGYEKYGRCGSRAAAGF